MYRFVIMLAAVIGLCSPVGAQTSPVSACPFTQVELKDVMGEDFEKGVADTPLSAGALTLESCRYASPRYTLLVSTTVYQRQEDAATHIQFMAGNKLAIPGDPDGAVYQEEQGDLTSPAVAYLRQGVVVELRILGSGYYDDPSKKGAAVTALREKLAKLRRIPSN